MLNRPYKCPRCKCYFRNESGMEWHLTHRHETPEVVETMRQTFETKEKTLQEANDEKDRKLNEANRQRESLEFQLKMNKLSNLLQRCHNCKSSAEAERLLFELRSMVLELGLVPYLMEQGYEQNAKGDWYKKSSGGAVESVSANNVDKPDTLAPLNAPPAPTAVSPNFLPEPRIIVPPVYDPEWLERHRATLGYGKYCPDSPYNQSAGPVTGSK